MKDPKKYVKEQQTAVPDVTGKTMEEAKKAIDKAKLRPIVLGEGKCSNRSTESNRTNIEG